RLFSSLVVFFVMKKSPFYSANSQILRTLFGSVTQMNWEKKLKLIQCIVYDLTAIHSTRYVHKDLYSGNILQTYVENAYIADL
ncbi:8053_t:CDS:1, partial [Gigaspora rosea]